MTPENQLLIWRIVLWGAIPLFVLVLGLVANFKIETAKTVIDSIKSEKGKAERLETEARIRGDIKTASDQSGENFKALSNRFDEIEVGIQRIDQKTIALDELINSAISNFKANSSGTSQSIDRLENEFAKFRTETRNQHHADEIEKKRNQEFLKSTLADLSIAAKDLNPGRNSTTLIKAIDLTAEYVEKGTYIETTAGNGLVNLELSIDELKSDNRIAFKDKLTQVLSSAEKRRDDEESTQEREQAERVQLVDSYSQIFLKYHRDIESYLFSFTKKLEASGLYVQITTEKDSFNPNAFVQNAREVLNKHNLRQHIRTYEIKNEKGLHLNVHFDATFDWSKLDRGFNPFGMHLYGDEVKGFGTRSWGIDIQKDGKLWGGRGEVLDLSVINSLMEEEWILDEKFWR